MYKITLNIFLAQLIACVGVFSGHLMGSDVTG